MNIDELLTEWRTRADQREASARRMGTMTIEGRILQADAGAVRQCIAELEDWIESDVNASDEQV